jgi:hypothetical protein
VRRQAWVSASLLQLVVVPLLFYLTWAVAYYLKIFVLSAERIRCVASVMRKNSCCTDRLSQLQCSVGEGR